LREILDELMSLTNWKRVRMCIHSHSHFAATIEHGGN
jgi:hypothetical protein